LMIEANNPNIPMLKGPKRRWALLITNSSNKIKYIITIKINNIYQN
jgi:hypothetical protein